MKIIFLHKLFVACRNLFISAFLLKSENSHGLAIAYRSPGAVFGSSGGSFSIITGLDVITCRGTNHRGGREGIRIKVKKPVYLRFIQTE